MQATVERLSPGKAVIHYEYDAQEYDSALNRVYLRDRGRARIPGFRPGKAPRPIIERYFGSEYMAFHAARTLLPEVYDSTLKDNNLTPVDDPDITIDKAEKGEPFLFSVAVTVYPEVTLGDYMTIDVARPSDFVDDDAVEQEIQRKREQGARILEVEDRPAKEDDVVNIDYAGTVDGEAFDGGAADDQELTLGSGQFIPGFEDQVIGMSAGEEKDINVTFPEAYGNDELNGKDAVFHVKLNSISEKELPELDDEFAKDVSEFDTLEEYRASVRKDLEEKAKTNAENEWDNELLERLAELSETEIPEIMIEREVEEDIYRYANRTFNNDRKKADDFFERIRNMSGIRESFRKQAGERLKVLMCMEKLAETEKLKYDEERDKDKLIEAITEAKLTQNMSVEEALKQLDNNPRLKENFTEMIGRKNTIAYLRDVAKRNAVKGEEPDACDL
ncbi:MAG: trigger factor [Oscillospiraceae bacterium]|jgi:trigger factor|nr:trigger factor [Oscillospiraceae bacterium]